MAGVADITDTDNMILMIANCYHFTICDIGRSARSCLGIGSVKSAQSAIDTLTREKGKYVLFDNVRRIMWLLSRMGEWSDSSANLESKIALSLFHHF